MLKNESRVEIGQDHSKTVISVLAGILGGKNLEAKNWVGLGQGTNGRVARFYSRFIASV